jgi:diguanylate cyclase (GGDEF)-like protein
VIGVAFDEPNRAFSEEEIELLQRFADLAAIALDNAQMISSAVRQSQELSLLHAVRNAITREVDLTHIVNRTVEAIARTFGYTLVSLYLLEGDTLVLQHQVGYENVISTIAITEGVSGYVVRTGEPVFLENVQDNPMFLGAIHGIVSEVAVPLLDEGKPVGVLNIESQHGVKMTEADLHLMIALSDQLSIAISRARVYSAMRRKNERLSILHEAALDLLNNPQLDELPQTITDHIVRLLDSDVGYLSLREGDDLVDRAITPADFPYSMASSKISEDISPVKQVYESGKPFLTENFSALPNIRLETAALGTQAMLLLPILYRDFCHGVVGAARFVNRYTFDEDDINFGNLYSRLAAIALDNAQLHEAMRQESIRDPLTGLFNRRFMQESLLQELRRAERTSRPLSIVMLDLDHFKNLNDMYGHDAGDEALHRLGLLLKTRIRGSDIACRYGGEEFTLILPEASMTVAVARMEELRQDIKQLVVRHDGRNVSRLTGSFGISAFPQHGTTPEQLLKAADEALYRAKQAGRDRVIAA